MGVLRNLDKLRPPLIFIISGVFLLLDRWLKWQAMVVWKSPRLINKFFGWEPFLNKGVAFSLPVPGPIIIALTVPVIILIVYDLIGSRKSDSGYRKSDSDVKRMDGLRIMGLVFILAGAISNLIDRLMWGVTVDYLLILTGVINLADVMIVGGVILYLLARQKKPV